MTTYKYLTDDDRLRIVKAQARQQEGEMFAHELALVRLEAVPTIDRSIAHEGSVVEAKEAIADIEKAVEVTDAEAKKLEPKALGPVVLEPVLEPKAPVV